MKVFGKKIAALMLSVFTLFYLLACKSFIRVSL
jgi:hypothetical protein